MSRGGHRRFTISGLSCSKVTEQTDAGMPSMVFDPRSIPAFPTPLRRVIGHHWPWYRLPGPMAFPGPGGAVAPSGLFSFARPGHLQGNKRYQLQGQLEKSHALEWLHDRASIRPRVIPLGFGGCRTGPRMSIGWQASPKRVQAFPAARGGNDLSSTTPRGGMPRSRGAFAAVARAGRRYLAEAPRSLAIRSGAVLDPMSRAFSYQLRACAASGAMRPRDGIVHSTVGS